MNTLDEISLSLELALKDVLQISKGIQTKDLDKITFLRPIIGEKGFKKIQKKQEIYYQKYIQKNKEQLKKPPSYSQTISKLEFFIKNNFKDIPSSDHKKIAEELLLQFFVTYLRTAQRFNFYKNFFSKSIIFFTEEILPFLDGRVFFTPIHNLKGNFEKIILSDNLKIRKISTKEFTKVADLKKTTSDTFGGLNDHPSRFLYNLQYVLEIRIKDANVTLEILKEVISKFDETISIMKLYKVGDLRIGAIYHQTFRKWEIEPIKRIGDENPQIGPNKFELKRKDVQKFLSFFKKVNSINLNDKKQSFLRLALKRFSQAISTTEFQDKIIDFWIALESLYHTPGDKTELSYRIANRSAILLGNNDEQRKFFYGFHKDCYSIRSSIVHSGFIKKMKILGIEQNEDYVLKNLESATRNSILKFLSLSYSMGTKHDDILKEIDNGLLDNNVRKILKSESKKLFR